MNKKIKILSIVIIIILVFIAIFICSTKSYTYSSNLAPKEIYKIKINKITKVLHGEFVYDCNDLDCENKTYKYSVKLTSKEYKKIMLVWDNKKELSPILENICKDEKVLNNSFKDSNYDSIDEYDSLDLNADGKITSREYGNKLLYDLVNKNNN